MLQSCEIMWNPRFWCLHPPQSHHLPRRPCVRLQQRARPSAKQDRLHEAAGHGPKGRGRTVGGADPGHSRIQMDRFQGKILGKSHEKGYHMMDFRNGKIMVFLIGCLWGMPWPIFSYGFRGIFQWDFSWEPRYRHPLFIWFHSLNGHGSWHM